MQTEYLDFLGSKKNLKYTIQPGVECSLPNLEYAQQINETEMIGHFIRFNSNATENYEVFSYSDDIEKSSNGYPLIR